MISSYGDEYCGVCGCVLVDGKCENCEGEINDILSPTKVGSFQTR